MELAAGRVQESDYSTLEKLPFYFAQSYKLCTMEMKYQETIDFCLSVLTELGCRLVPNGTLLPIQALVSLMRTIRMVRKVDKDRYQELCLMVDPKQKASMLFLNSLFYASYLSKNDFLLILSVTQIAHMTLKHGVSAVSGPTFACLGLVTVAIMRLCKTTTRLRTLRKQESQFKRELALYTTKQLPSILPTLSCHGRSHCSLVWLHFWRVTLQQRYAIW